MGESLPYTFPSQVKAQVVGEMWTRAVDDGESKADTSCARGVAWVPSLLFMYRCSMAQNRRRSCILQIIRGVRGRRKLVAVFRSMNHSTVRNCGRVSRTLLTFCKLTSRVMNSRQSYRFLRSGALPSSELLALPLTTSRAGSCKQYLPVDNSAQTWSPIAQGQHRQHRFDTTVKD